MRSADAGARQFTLFGAGFDVGIAPAQHIAPFKTPLLKWIGSKQRFAHEIAGYFPGTFGTYVEPFIGAGGVLATLAPTRAIASDVLKPLIEIWQTLADDPDMLKSGGTRSDGTPSCQATL